MKLYYLKRHSAVGLNYIHVNFFGEHTPRPPEEQCDQLFPEQNILYESRT